MNCNNCGKSIRTGVGYCGDCAAEMQRIKAERDAAIENLTNVMKGDDPCVYCKHLINTGTTECELNLDGLGCVPEWRGVQQ